MNNWLDKYDEGIIPSAQGGTSIFDEGARVAREEYLRQQYQDYLRGEAQKGREAVQRGMHKGAKKILPWMAVPFAGAAASALTVIPLITAPSATIAGMVGGTAGMYLTDRAVKRYSDDKYGTWGEMMAGETGIPPILGEFTNPGALIGGMMGSAVPGVIRKIPGQYSNLVTAAQKGQLYKINPFARKADPTKVYTTMTENRARYILDKNAPITRYSTPGKRDVYHPVFDDKGNITHYVVQSDMERFLQTGGANTPIGVYFMNKMRTIPSTIGEQLRRPKYKNTMYGLPDKTSYGYSYKKTLNEIIEEAIKQRGAYSSISPDVKFRFGAIPNYGKPKGAQIIRRVTRHRMPAPAKFEPNPIIMEGDPTKISFVGAPSKAERLQYIPRDIGNFPIGKTAIPEESIIGNELSYGPGLRMMRQDPVWGLSPLREGEMDLLRTTSVLPERESRITNAILGFDKALNKAKSFKLSSVNVNMPPTPRELIDRMAGTYRGYVTPIQQKVLAGDRWSAEDDLVFRKLSSLRKLTSELEGYSPNKKAELFKLIESSPLSNEELQHFINQYRSGVGTFTSKVSLAQDIAQQRSPVKGIKDVQVFADVSNQPNQTLIDLSKRSDVFKQYFEKQYQKRIDKILETKAVPMLPSGNDYPEGVIGAMFRNYTADVHSELEQAIAQIKASPGGKTFMGSESLSAESYPLTVYKGSSIFGNDPEYGIFRGEYMPINTYDDFRRLGVNPEYIATYLNNYLRRVNVGGKQFPAARVNKYDNTVEVPTFYLKKYKGGGIIPSAQGGKSVIFAESPPITEYNMFDDSQNLPPVLSEIRQRHDQLYRELEKTYSEYEKKKNYLTQYVKGYTGENVTGVLDEYYITEAGDVNAYPSEVIQSKAYKEYIKLKNDIDNLSRRRSWVKSEFSGAQRVLKPESNSRSSTFITEGNKLRDWYKKKGIESDVIPIYGMQDTTKVNQALQAGNIADIGILGHAGCQLGGISLEWWNKRLVGTDYNRCILGSCHGGDYIGLLPDVKNIYHTTSRQPWHGVNPSADTFENALFSTREYEVINPVRGRDYDVYRPTYQHGGTASAQDAIPSSQYLRHLADHKVGMDRYMTEQSMLEQAGTITESEPRRSVAGKVWNVLSHPATALSYAVRNQPLPEHFERGPQSPLDIPVSSVNPFAYANAVAQVPRDVRQGNYLNAALTVAPLVPMAARTTSSLVRDFKKTGSIGEIAANKLFGIPYKQDLPRLSTSRVNDMRIVQQIGRMEDLNDPLEMRWQHAIDNNLSDDDFVKLFGVSKETAKDAIGGIEKTWPGHDMTARTQWHVPNRREREVSNILDNLSPEVTENLMVGNFNVLPRELLRDLALLRPSPIGFKPLINRGKEAISSISERAANAIAQPYKYHTGDVKETVNFMSMKGAGSFREAYDPLRHLPKNVPSGMIVTGSTNTSHSSYLPQLKRIFRYKEGSPVFLGYKPMNNMGYLSRYDYSPTDISSYLNSEIDQQVLRGIVPSNIARPFSKGENVILPQYGIKHFKQGGKVSKIANITKYDEHIWRAAKETGADPYVLKAIIMQESSFRPRKNKLGYEGFSQTNQETIDTVNRNMGTSYTIEDQYDPYMAAKFIAHNLELMKKKGWATSLDEQLIGYNWGPGYVKRYRKTKELPKETANYVAKINEMISEWKPKIETSGSPAPYPAVRDATNVSRTLPIYDIPDDAGIVQDNAGYLNPSNYGSPVRIGSNDITMRGVPFPVLGVSDEGEVRIMMPGEDHRFKGSTVTEFPLAQNTDNLSNFTKPKGWLDKYE